MVHVVPTPPSVAKGILVVKVPTQSSLARDLAGPTNQAREGKDQRPIKCVFVTELDTTTPGMFSRQIRVPPLQEVSNRKVGSIPGQKEEHRQDGQRGSSLRKTGGIGLSSKFVTD